MKLKAIIIDDELNAREMLEWLIKTWCKEVEVVAMCTSAEEGLKSIQEQQLDIVFLDIEMPHMNGFEMLEKLNGDHSFELIFTTAYDQYAIRAFRYSAFNYLLKPIDHDDLRLTVERILQKKHQAMRGQLDLLMEHMKAFRPSVQRIALSTGDGLRFVKTDEIIYCQAESNYTQVKLVTGESILVSKTLKDIDETLSGDNFFRVHNSFVINLNQIKKFVRGEGGYVLMNDGQQITIARSKRDEFFARFEKF